MTKVGRRLKGGNHARQPDEHEPGHYGLRFLLEEQESFER